MASVKNLTFLLLGEDKTASSTMTRVQQVAEKTTGAIGSRFTALGSTIGGEFGEILNRTGEGIESVGAHTKNASVVMGAAGGVVASLGTALMQAGSADKQASDQLKQSIETTGHSYDQYREEIEKTIATQENYGHGAADTQQALQKMTTAFQDPKKAMEDMGVVANLAASKHISLADAADLVVRITAGKGAKTLSQYGITMDQSIKDPSARSQKALEELSHKVDNQASASMNNFGAKVNVVKTKMGDWIADFGTKAGPGIAVFGGALMGLSATMELVKGGIALFKGIQIANTVATEAGTVAQGGFNIALLASPITWIVVAIVALVAVVVLLATHWKEVTKFVTTVWDGFLKWGKQVVEGFGKWWNDFWGGFAHWITDLWHNMVKSVHDTFDNFFKGLKIIGHDISTWWNGLWTGIGNWARDFWTNHIVGPIAGAMTWIHDRISDGLNKIHDVWSNIWNGLGSIAHDAFQGAINWIVGGVNGAIDTINGLIRTIDHIPGVNVHTIGHVAVPHFAMGGIVTGPTMALIGESGPEAVIPLNAGIPGVRGLSGGGAPVIHVTVNAGAVGDERHLAQVISDALVNAIRSGRVNPGDLKRTLGIA